MYIKSVHFTGFRGIHDLELPLFENVNVITGVNGSGKSTILDGISLMLSWAVARIRHPRGMGKLFDKTLDIHQEAQECQISIEMVTDQEALEWRVVGSRHGRTVLKSDLQMLKGFADRLISKMESGYAELPLFLHYPVHRSVLDIPLRIKEKNLFDPLNAYDEGLTSAANFRLFFEWFRNREDLENEQLRYGLNTFTCDPQLQCVRHALEAFLPGMQKFSIRRNPLRFVVEKSGISLRVDQLSDGEKTLIALVGDLARRLAMANPHHPTPTQGKGVVLIDEIDLHLHPEWQRQIVANLQRVFPCCQFILSTHSPQVLGEVEASHIRNLKNDRGQIIFEIPNQSFGLSSNQVVDELMTRSTQPLSRNVETENSLAEIFHLIETEDFEGARIKISQLEERLNGLIPELVEANTMLHLYGPQGA